MLPLYIVKSKQASDDDDGCQECQVICLCAVCARARMPIHKNVMQRMLTTHTKVTIERRSQSIELQNKYVVLTLIIKLSDNL